MSSIQRERWVISRLKYYVDINPSKAEVSGLPQDTEVSFLPMEAVSESGEFDASRNGTISDYISGYTYFRDGDVLLAKITPCFENGKSALVYGLKNGLGFGSTEFHVLRAKGNMDPSYLAYLVRSHPFRAFGEASMIGAAGQKRVPESFVTEFKQAFPTLKEQRAIASFLDRETAKLDQLIEKKRRLIELLQEYRQAIITQAVTKGLDPNVPMKVSGIPWLGEVPVHWEIRQLKYLATFQGGGTPSKDDLAFWDGDIPWVSPKDMKQEVIVETEDHISRAAVDASATKIIPPGNVLLVVRSGILKHTLPVAMNGVAVTLNQDMKALIPHRSTTSSFLFWSLKGLGPHILSVCRKIGATVDSIDMELLYRFPIPLAPLSEQEAISLYLEEKCNLIGKAVDKLQQELNLLAEYRQALISAAVTGQIDVRQWSQGEVEVALP